jgi:fused signal recognition particle receptor
MSGSETERKKPGLFSRLFGRKEAPRPAEAEAAPPEPDTPAPAAALEAEASPPAAAWRKTPPPAEEPTPEAAPEAPSRRSWFQRLKSGLARTSSSLTTGIAGVFTRRKLDAGSLAELEDLLIQADLGIDMAARVTKALSSGRYEKGISPEEVREVLAAEIEKVLIPVEKPLQTRPGKKPHIVLMVGVNGTGKTTTIGKLAEKARREGHSVMIAAGDTFRAAAIDQLRIWGERTGARVFASAVGADSAGLAFDALKAAREAGTDLLLIDTAGRLQNKGALMAELEKIVRVIRKLDDEAPHDVLLVLDATTGQNAMSQVEAFGRSAGVTGLIMTKLDGTARGGILVAIADKHGLPIHAIGVGETSDDLEAFDAREFARTIAGL